MKDGFELVRGFETNTDRFLHLRYEARVLALQISAAIICKFESNKQTKHNLFPGPRTHKSHFIDFPVCLPAQPAISFPGKMGRVYCNMVDLYPTFNSFSTFFPSFFVISEPGKCVLCGSLPARWGSGNIVSLEIGLS